jgi:hypothetical protein
VVLHDTYSFGPNAATIISVSDERLKENIVSVPDALHKVSKLNGVYFSWIGGETIAGENDEAMNLGLIAQDVQSVLPEAVSQLPTAYVKARFPKTFGTEGTTETTASTTASNLSDSAQNINDEEGFGLQASISTDDTSSAVSSTASSSDSDLLSDYLGVMYDNVIPLLIQAVNQLQHRPRIQSAPTNISSTIPSFCSCEDQDASRLTRMRSLSVKLNRLEKQEEALLLILSTETADTR